MKYSISKTLLALGVLSLFTTGCDLFNSEVIKSENILSGVDEELFDLPSSIAAGDTEPQTAMTLKTTAPTEESDESIFNAYKPVPAYIGFANTAKNHVKAFVKELSKYDIPANMTFEENGMKIVATSVDTTILNADQRFFRINIFKENELVLHLNYWKNARNQLRGNFFYYETEKVDEVGNRVFIHFNNHNSELFGKRMVVTFYQPVENLKEVNDPQIIRVRAVKKESKIFASGASYHPTFVDENGFWENGQYVYAFAVVANSNTDKAVLKAAFAPANAAKVNLLNNYSIDKMVLQQLYAKTQRDEITGERKPESELQGMRRVIRWSLETGKPFDETDSTIITQVFIDFQPSVSLNVEITTEEFRQYLLNHKELFEQRGLPQELELVKFVSMKQPIFLSAQAAIEGSAYDEEVNNIDFGIDQNELENDVLLEIDPAEAINFDPEVQADMEWEE